MWYEIKRKICGLTQSRFFVKYFWDNGVWILEETDANGRQKTYADKNLMNLLKIIEDKYKK